MLSLTNIKPTTGSRKTSKRLGRGNASGKGTTCGRGANGQNSRSGGGVPQWFEGGQTPLFRRMPKLKGFSNAVFKKEYNVVNISDLVKLADKGITDINAEVLLENRIVRKKSLPIKLLGNGELTTKLTVIVDKASASAKEAIEKAGGKIELK
ncbi:MAG: 50S ribosomal protein L15 [Candidatus Gracilibacteria bacterium]|nr:50S ribosomal protein L15 [Candidatus Gracilibacteria bacterium]